jgi:hypothetical protein
MNIHSKAMTCANNYKRAEAELLEVLQLVDQHRVYLEHSQTSTFGYVVHVLGLSESVAYNFIAVARKSVEIPELKTAIQSGELSVNKARKITSVLDSENHSHWIGLAKTLPQAKLEKEVARVQPELALPEKIKPVFQNRMLMQLGVSEKLLEKLKRVQDLESQRTKTPATLEQTLEVLAEGYLKRNDPMEKAKRFEIRSTKAKKSEVIQTVNENKNSPLAPETLQPVSRQEQKRQTQTYKTRRVLPAQLKHRINLRDKWQCTHLEKDQRCANKRWLEIHHVQPLSLGGTHELNNLTTLCSAHHRHLHHEM